MYPLGLFREEWRWRILIKILYPTGEIFPLQTNLVLSRFYLVTPTIGVHRRLIPRSTFQTLRVQLGIRPQLARQGFSAVDGVSFAYGDYLFQPAPKQLNLTAGFPALLFSAGHFYSQINHNLDDKLNGHFDVPLRVWSFLSVPSESLSPHSTWPSDRQLLILFLCLCTHRETHMCARACIHIHTHP